MNARTPSDALAALRGASRDGTLGALCDRHDVSLLVVFGSTVTNVAPNEARDLDVAVHGGTRLDVLGLLADLTDLTRLDAIDLLDLRRAGPVAAVEALHHGEVLVERSSGLADRLLMRATLEKMDTQWLRDWALELMAS
jgi:predicted nucleotidyltransferase